MVDTYANGPKNQERREYYSFVDWCLGPVIPTRDRRVMVMESKEGREVEELRRRGYYARHIYAVNRSAAEIATMNRALTHRVNPVGLELGAAVRRRFLPERISFHAANLDFTGKVQWDLLTAIWWASMTVEDGGVIRVAVQRGREDGEWARFAKQHLGAGGEDNVELLLRGRELTAWDRVRYRAIFAALTLPNIGQQERSYPGRELGRARVLIYRSAGAKVDMLVVYAQLLYPNAAGVMNVPLRQRLITARAAARGDGLGLA